MAPRPERANPWLVGTGVGLLLVATIGLFINSNVAIVSAFLFLGVVAMIVAVLEPRLEGELVASPGSIKLNLRRIETSIEVGEAALREQLITLEEVVDE